MKKLSFFIFAVGTILVIFAYQFYVSGLRFSLNSASDQRILVDIEQGASAEAIGRLLHEKGLITSPLVFRLYLKQQGLESQLKAGRTVMQENFTLPRLAEALTTGGSEVEVSVTLLEGWTARQVAEYLQELGLTEADTFMDCVENCDFDFDFLPDYTEGYLYPDTYFVNALAFDDEVFINRLIATLENKLTDEDWQAVENSDHSFEEIMIMASIVEREERNPDERATVAGILWNRFDSGAGLGADATVFYALGRTKGGLTAADLQVDSPYNTRKYRGLPPTPIANPNISSIRAALYPEETDYWYYLHDPEGGIHYGKTLEEHNTNKAKYL